MAISLKETKVVSEMADLLYHFLPGSGSSQWKGYVTFPSVANEVGLGEFWQSGSKKPAITELLVRTLEHRRDLFEKLILTIVKEGLKYCQKNNEPITDDEIRTLNGLIMEVGFKFPSLCDPAFIDSLQKDRRARSSEIVEPEPNDHETRMRERLEFLNSSNAWKS